MNPNAQKWVDALRSGEYAQATGQLKSPDGGYCCHGVACELFADEVYGEWDETFFLVEGDAYHEMPPPSVLAALDLDPEFADNLAVYNDRHFSFDRIADIIEAYFNES